MTFVKTTRIRYYFTGYGKVIDSIATMVSNANDDNTTSNRKLRHLLKTINLTHLFMFILRLQNIHCHKLVYW